MVDVSFGWSTALQEWYNLEIIQFASQLYRRMDVEEFYKSVLTQVMPLLCFMIMNVVRLHMLNASNTEFTIKSIKCLCFV